MKINTTSWGTDFVYPSKISTLRGCEAFAVQTITALMEPEYQCYPMYCSSEDAGHAGAARTRTYIIMRYIAETDCLGDPIELYYKIADCVKSQVATEPKDYMIATQEEIRLEAQSVARSRGIVYNPHRADLEYLLLPRELDVLNFARNKYESTYNRAPDTDPNLAIFLGDNSSYSVTWSAHSHRIPTFRMNAGMMYFPYYGRWMCHAEKLATFGFPVRASLASALGTPTVPVRDERRAASLAGNCMVLPVVTIVTLVALSCVADKKCTGSAY